MCNISNMIVKCEDYFEDKENYFMVLEYCQYHGYFEELLEKVNLY